MNKKYLNINFCFCFFLIFIILQWVPYLVFQSNSTFRVHDNLDSEFVYIKLFLEGKFNSDFIFAKNGSSPRLSFSSLIMYLLGPLNSIIFERLLIPIIAFLGMQWFLRKHFLVKDEFLLYGVSCAFSLLPFFPFGGLSVAGLPIVFGSLLNFRANVQTFKDYLLFLVIALYSSLVLSGFFVLFVFLVVLLFDWWVKGIFNINLFLGLSVLSLLYIVSHNQLVVATFLDNSGLSHRTEFRTFDLGFKESVIQGIDLFLYGQDHSNSYQWSIIVLTSIIGGFFLSGFHLKRFRLLWTYLILASTFYGIWKCDGTSEIRYACMKIFPMKFDRFYMLSPFFWYVVFALGLIGIKNRIPLYGKHIVTVLILLQIGFVLSKHELYVNRNGPTFKQFFATQQFKQIKNHLDSISDNKTYKVMSLGMHPSITQYNNFKTVDGYFTNYPLSYKRAFRTIISKELDKSQELKNYFDKWGSRCYIFCSKLGKNYCLRKGNGLIVDSFDINTKQAYKMGARYLLSTVLVNTKYQTGLCLIKKFSHTESNKDIYVYKIKAL